MNSRDKILQKVRKNQPPLINLPELIQFNAGTSKYDQFESVLRFIGGTVIPAASYADILEHIMQEYPEKIRMVTTVAELIGIGEQKKAEQELHLLADVDLAVIKAKFGVAENGALWVTDNQLGKERVLPFICQHLAVILERNQIVPGMHEAYKLIGMDNYDFGTFIAGPSKTADIEQSLVLGAHGAKSMTVYVINNQDPL